MASAQKEQFDRASYYSYGVKMFAEAHTLPDEAPDSVNVLFLFKTIYDALIFIQVNPLDNPGSFQATPNIEILLKDDNGVIRNRMIWSDTVWTKDYNDTKSKEKFAEGFVTLKMLAGNYNCTVNLLDRYKKVIEKVELNLNSKFDFHKSNIISDPIFTASNSSLAEYRSVPFILSNKINFTSKDAKILIPVSYSLNHNVFYYSIKKDTKKEDQFWNDMINLSGKSIPSDNCNIVASKNLDLPVTVSIKSGYKYNTGNDRAIGVLDIKLPSENLSPGNYTLTIKNDNNKDSAEYSFEVIWVDMPLSMRNPSYSLEMMYYILNDEEYDKLNSGSNDKKTTKIMEYWKQKDPTRSTPFNEAMTEYFRRVDYAFFNFQTTRDKDGAKTERGKIHILFGKPDNIEKDLISGKQYEIWTYIKLKKKFHFELVSNGLYQLTKIDE